MGLSVLTTLTAAGTADASTLVSEPGWDLCTSDDRSNGGRPFVGWFDPLTTVHEGPPAEVPPLRPDQSVAFERRGGIWRVPVAGGRARRVVRSGRQPAWSR